MTTHREAFRALEFREWVQDRADLQLGQEMMVVQYVPFV